MFKLNSIILQRITRNVGALTIKRCNTSNKDSSTFFDPPYLESMKPKIPLCPPINIQIKGYDFALVECYQKAVHRIAKILDIDVEDGWALPAKVEKIQKFKPNSAIVDDEYVLSTYERNIQVVDVSVNVMPIFIEMIQAALPQGISFQVHEHLEKHEADRYVPDYDLKELKTQLDTLGGPLKKKSGH